MKPKSVSTKEIETEWLPKLYKKTSVGKDQEWQIGVAGNIIATRWGQVGGTIQESWDVIKTGKNMGKKNETTADEQASLEATAQWRKKLKKGYVRSLEDARAGEVDSVIEGGVNPMLAHRFDEQGHKIVYPAYAQPKLDGHRCIGVVKYGQATLWSRTRKRITSMPHIEKALSQLAEGLGEKDITFDGELYNHAYHDNFEELTRLIRPDEPRPGHEAVQYHLYDVVMPEEPFRSRIDVLADAKVDLLMTYGGPGILTVVPTKEVADEDELLLAFEQFLADGYEGAMVRNAAGLYENKRSYGLQKIKEFKDGEFEIVAVEEGRGKLVGHAIFVCQTSGGERFNAKMKGKTSDLKKYWDKPELAIGEYLTVQYQGMTKYDVPRFPVALRFRKDL